MSVFEVRGGRINRRYLERKTKDELCSMYLDLLDRLESMQKRARADELELDDVLKTLRGLRNCTWGNRRRWMDLTDTILAKYKDREVQ